MVSCIEGIHLCSRSKRLCINSCRKCSRVIACLTIIDSSLNLCKSSRCVVINSLRCSSIYIVNLTDFDKVEDGKLLSYNTEYDSANVTLEGDIVDPFLLTVLRDKRRHNRLTDIIRTIQANQNDIIRLPRQESFVVQGCAGSGKTMILLHRLSFLLFNNRNISPATIKIITPNKFFDAHINDLSHELGLDQIPRYTVEEYYVELIRRFSSKIDVDSSVSSEKGLSEALLQSVYSQEYVDRFAQHYHEYWSYPNLACHIFLKSWKRYTPTPHYMCQKYTKPLTTH